MNYQHNCAKTKRFLILAGFFLILAQILAAAVFAQKRKVTSKSAKKTTAAKKASKDSATAQNSNLPKVTQIDVIALKNLLKREGENARPLLVNFWATWCEPCREEFPELVQINRDYAGKIDFIIVSLDDLAEIKRDVPKFLIEMKAEMPAYLLKTEDEQAAIAAISKNYSGGLPFTILFNGKGESVYFRQGKIKTDILRQQIEKLTKENP